MKKNYLILATVAALALMATSCNLPVSLVSAPNSAPQENFPAEERPPEGFPPEERPPEGFPPQDQPPEEHPPEQPGDVQIMLTADHMNVQSGECATILWEVYRGYESGYNVTFNGDHVDQVGERQVCPNVTTTYHVAVDTGKNIVQQEITITVVGGGQPQPGPQAQPTQNSSQPQPTKKPTQAQKKSVTPTPTMLILQLSYLDLAVDNIYPAASGKIMIRIKNTGTQLVKNNIKVSCQAYFVTQSGQDTYPPFQNKTVTINLAPGITADYETGYVREPKWKSQVVSCQITPPAGDFNSANNAKNNVKVK
jgi:hypothetical protein